MTPSLYVIGALGLATLAAGGYAAWERGDRIAAEAAVADRDKLLETNRQALADLTRDRDRQVASLETLAIAVRNNTASLAPVRSAINATANNAACLANPGVRGLREYLAARRASGTAGNPAIPVGTVRGAADAR